MIKVLIVEDDQLVRKGLMFAMPWSEFDMKVVGEASNGKKGLEFLEHESVDLVITDINMPVMSGMEFMRIVKERYPKVFIAVLTLHQDFEYIQEALRLGAIDFITKVQLEKEKFDQVLERIHKRIVQEKTEDSQFVNEAYCQKDTGIAFFFQDEIQQTNWVKQIKRIKHFSIQQIDQTVWFCYGTLEAEPENMLQELLFGLQGQDEYFVVKVNGIKGRLCNQVYRLLLSYRDKLFFYECMRQKNYSYRSIGDIEKEIRVSITDKTTVKKKLFSFKWVYEEQQFEVMISEVERLYLLSEDLHQLVQELLDEWNKQYPFIPTTHINTILEINEWNQFIKWLSDFRATIKLTAGNDYAEDVVNSILIALKLIQEKLHEALTADEVAKLVTMSRSYFNKCFKDIVGKSFHQYLREHRIEKAKSLIEQTNEPLQWIAEQIGYLDEKYFSRVFREQIGVLPSEYRKKHRKGDRRPR
ncbi:response regulator transcription factor [Halalkalibacter urbisdiaboli]|uniref:response regulator transcription factor n=1 Tax=Halalkalibacter urbisdiaboli TaxID=1960589 RepID=UPI0013FD7FEF|nr:response regulator [Halalkalibacter urbisdiaboli]